MGVGIRRCEGDLGWDGKGLGVELEILDLIGVKVVSTSAKDDLVG